MWSDRPPSSGMGLIKLELCSIEIGLRRRVYGDAAVFWAEYGFRRLGVIRVSHAIFLRLSSRELA